jgi:hypothetical protein
VKLFWTIFLGLLGLIGLGMTLCGAMVTLTGLGDPGQGIYLLMFSVPSIAIGVFLILYARNRFRELDKPGGGNV